MRVLKGFDGVNYVETLCSMERASDAMALSNALNKKLPAGWTTTISDETDILLHGKNKRHRSEMVGIFVSAFVDGFRAAIYI